MVIAEDQELVRAGFTMVINSQPDMQVVGQASDGTHGTLVKDPVTGEYRLAKD